MSQSDWLEENFERVEEGYIVYKRIGHTQYRIPDRWVIKEGSILEEVPNPDRCTECGCGVNFGTKEYVSTNYTHAPLWECLIQWEDFIDVIVPFNTNGKARCGKLKLIRVVPEEEIKSWENDVDE